MGHIGHSHGRTHLEQSRSSNGPALEYGYRHLVIRNSSKISPSTATSTKFTILHPVKEYLKSTNLKYYGGDFNIFRPKTSRREDEDYRVEVLSPNFATLVHFQPRSE